MELDGDASSLVSSSKMFGYFKQNGVGDSSPPWNRKAGEINVRRPLLNIRNVSTTWLPSLLIRLLRHFFFTISRQFWLTNAKLNWKMNASTEWASLSLWLPTLRFFLFPIVFSLLLFDSFGFILIPQEGTERFLFLASFFNFSTISFSFFFGAIQNFIFSNLEVSLIYAGWRTCA